MSLDEKECETNVADYTTLRDSIFPIPEIIYGWPLKDLERPDKKGFPQKPLNQ